MKPDQISLLNKHIPNWKSLDYSAASDLSYAVRLLMELLYPKWIEKENLKYRNRAKEREDKKENFEKNIAPRILEWVKDNLKPGMIIKLEGCRDKGYREVSEFDPRTNNVICWQLRWGGGKGFGKTGVATTNSIFKIKKVYADWGGADWGGDKSSWRDMKDLIGD